MRFNGLQKLQGEESWVFEGIHHVAIICCDYEKSKIFYTKILGLDVIAENYRADRESHKLDLALANGNQLEIFSFPDAPRRQTRPEALGLRHLAFSVASVQETADYLQSCGVEVEPIRLDEYTGKKFTFFQDPDGLPLEIYEH